VKGDLERFTVGKNRGASVGLMNPSWLLITALLLVELNSQRSRAADSATAADFARDVVPFLAKHCYHCHGGDKRQGDLALDGYSNNEAVQRERKVWLKVSEMVRSGEMPPDERPRPDPAETETALAAVDAVLTASDCHVPRPAARVTLRRLNRAEYDNTIRDLVGVDFKPAADFPNDDIGYGFDNIGDVLSLSPLLLEKYLRAAELVLDQAIVAVGPPPKPAKTQLELRASRRAGGVRKEGGQYLLHSDGAIFANGFLEAGDYHIRIEATGQQAGDEPVRGTLKINDAEITRFELKTDSSATTVIEADTRIAAATSRVVVVFLNPYRVPDPTDEAKAAGNKLADDHQPATQAKLADEKKEKPFRGFDRPPAREPDDKDRLLIVRGIEFDGPHNPPPPSVPESHQRIMGHQGDLPPREAAREIVTRFASRAFRRPVRAADIDPCLELYDLAEKESEPFEECVKLALSRVLVSPHFLFRVELDPPGAQPGISYPISEYELASRLSYFFWSSMPDEELLGLAASGRLRAELEPQLARMLKDTRSAAFVQNFAGQWLTLRKLAEISPDPAAFPDFDTELRSAMVRETELFFEAVLREDRGIFDLLDADFSFVNERLAKHYGIDGVSGPDFQRVKLPANRSGVLTHASILTLTSNPTRTSPVKRGKWVLEQLLNTPPPPPPPDVPQLDEARELTGSLRQRLEQHRANPQCASCHQRMDPLGFAFENFDAIGRWRDKDGEFAIDVSGELPDGQKFQGPAELKVILKAKKDLFRRCLTEKILTYALGRGLEHYDFCAVDTIVESLEKNDDKFSTLLVETVKSEPFQMRTAVGASTK
jgi:hypothetical protein